MCVCFDTASVAAVAAIKIWLFHKTFAFLRGCCVCASNEAIHDALHFILRIEFVAIFQIFSWFTFLLSHVCFVCAPLSRSTANFRVNVLEERRKSNEIRDYFARRHVQLSLSPDWHFLDCHQRSDTSALLNSSCKCYCDKNHWMLVNCIFRSTVAQVAIITHSIFEALEHPCRSLFNAAWLKRRPTNYTYLGA